MDKPVERGKGTDTKICSGKDPSAIPIGRFRGLLEEYGDYGDYGRFGALGNAPNLLTFQEFQDRGQITREDLFGFIEKHEIWPQVSLPEPIWLRRIPCHLTNLLHDGAKDLGDKIYPLNIPYTFDDGMYLDIVNSYWKNLSCNLESWISIDRNNLWLADFHYASIPNSGYFIGAEQVKNIKTYGYSIVNNITIPIFSRTDDDKYHLIFDRFLSNHGNNDVYRSFVYLLRTPYESQKEMRQFIYDDWEATIITASRLSITNSISESKMIDFIKKCGKFQANTKIYFRDEANKEVTNIIAHLYRIRPGAKYRNEDYELFLQLLDLSCYMDKWIPAFREQSNIRITLENIYISEDQIANITTLTNPENKNINKRSLNVRTIAARSYQARAEKVLVTAARKLLVKIRREGISNKKSLIDRWVSEAANDFSKIESQGKIRDALSGKGQADDLKASVERYLLGLIRKNSKDPFD
ncbi:hypothetical protein AAE485_08020 [Acidithiobacillus ferriphilus]|uniref:hypothetical protein n=1 Tax=Acidithiobacillus ferriphilus TaxID=1689834 RepID=UPI00390C4C4A